MGKVKLSVKEYNMLYQEISNYINGYNFVFCRVIDDKVCITSDFEGEDVIASINADTKEGKLLSNFTDCLLKAYMDDDGRNIMLNYNCEYCDNEFGCKFAYEKRKQIENIQFIDPMPNRTSEMVDTLKHLKEKIAYPKKDYTLKNEDNKIQEINKTISSLEKQINGLLDEWKYQTEGE